MTYHVCLHSYWDWGGRTKTVWEFRRAYFYLPAGGHGHPVYEGDTVDPDIYIYNLNDIPAHAVGVIWFNKGDKDW